VVGQQNEKSQKMIDTLDILIADCGMDLYGSYLARGSVSGLILQLIMLGQLLAQKAGGLQLLIIDEGLVHRIKKVAIA